MRRRLRAYLLIFILMLSGGAAYAEDAQSDYLEGMVWLYAEEYEQAYLMFTRAGRYLDANEYSLYCAALVALEYALKPDALVLELTDAQRAGDEGMISQELLSLAVYNLELLSKNGFMQGQKNSSENLLNYARGRLAEINDSLHEALEYYYACPLIYDVITRIDRIKNIFEYLPVIKSAVIDGEEAIIKWSAVEDAKSYDVFVCGEIDGVYEFEGSVKKTEYAWTMDENRFSQAYFKVRAVYENRYKPSSLNKRYGDALGAWQSDMRTAMPYTDAGFGLNVTPLSAASEPVLVVSRLDMPVITDIVLNNGQIQVAWRAVKEAKSYQVLRNGSIVELDFRTTIYSDKDFIYGAEYEYQIIAQHDNELRNSQMSKARSYRAILSAPIDVRAYLDNSGKVQITWKKVDNADNYSVYRLDNKTNKEVRISYSGGLSYTDNDVDGGVSYSYWVTASNKSYESERSSKVQVTTKYDLKAPALVARVDGNDVALSWKSEYSAEEYEIYRSTSENAKGVTIAKVGKVETYVDENLSPGIYYYSICSINGYEYSDRSSQTKAQIMPAAVSIERISDCGNGKIELIWKAEHTATSYVIYRNGQKIDTVTTTHYIDRVAAGSEYRYSIAAVVGSVEGKASDGKACYAAESIAVLSKSNLVISESSHLSNNPTDVIARNLFDGSIQTAWCEGANGYYGEWVEASTGSTSYWLSGVKIINGFRQDRFWELNSRVKMLEVWCNKKYITTLSLMDTKSEQTFYLPYPVLCSSIRFVIVDVYGVYSTTDPDDPLLPYVCLNEITLI